MIELANNKQNLVIKRDGREEPYDPNKMYQVLLWASDNNTTLVQSILDAIDIKIYNKIPIQILFDEVIDTTSNLISRLTPQYESVARNLYLLKQYKELWGIKRNEYPTLKQYFTRFKKYLTDDVNLLTDTELAQLDEAIKPERDKLSTFLGLQVFFEKYSINRTELLQHGYMRMAIQPYLYYPVETRVDKIITRYNHLSLGYYTEATPKFKNSLRKKFYGASCCVHKMDDNTESINGVTSDIAQYSRADGGNAVDISDLRAIGSPIGTVGTSNGPIPFIKQIEASVNAYNQNGTRPGVCAVYYPWWHANVMDLLPLMDEGGKENQRARALKFGIKVNRLFLKAIKEDDYVYLFDPKIVPELNHTYGEQFDDIYEDAVINHKYSEKIKARTIALAMAKERLETGNLYIFFVENANENTPFKEMIYSSNLCTEIYLPTKATKYFKKVVAQILGKDKYITQTNDEVGLTALCNLSSINVAKWYTLSPIERELVMRELLESSDNLIDLQDYPTPEGELFNRNYRAIGIGMTNLAYAFASNLIKFGSHEALAMMKNISVTMKEAGERCSYELALERGSFPWIDRTNLEQRRFATLFAIAPAATSALISGFTEGIEPLSKLVSEKTGTYSSKQLAPKLTELGPYYELASDIPTKTLYDLAAIRQKYLLDQGQSVNTYAKDPTSAYEVINDIIYAESIGLKGLYYLQSNTAIEACDSCGA